MQKYMYSYIHMAEKFGFTYLNEQEMNKFAYNIGC